MKKLFTFLMAVFAMVTASAQTSTVLFEDADAPILSWSVACSVSAEQMADLKAGDQFVVTVNARQQGNEWPKFGFENADESIYPDVFEMWNHDGETKTFPLNATYTVSAGDVEMLKGGFDIKGDGVQITKVVYVQNEPEDLPEGETVLYNNPEAPMLSWSTLCTVTASQMENLNAGDKFVVTVNARQEGNEWPKFGFETEDEDIYPDVFEMWDKDDANKTFPLTVTYIVSAADVEILKNGFEIKGDGVQITRVVYIQEEPEVLPEGESVIYNNPDAPMLSWSTLCSVTAAQVDGIQAGDQFVVTVSARQEVNEWPKFGFVAGDEEIYPEEFEMWGDDKTFPLVVTYTISAGDADILKNGFEIKGDGVQITRVVFVAKNGEVDPEIVLWSGEPTLMTWGAGPTVAAGKASAIEAGDTLAITVTEIVTGENSWPKVVCRCEDGWDEIFSIELSADETYPLVKNVEITSAMLENLHKGFNFGGESAYISKVVLVKESAGVVEIAENNGMVSVFTFNGMCVRRNVEASSALTDLPAGLYIVGGKKVLVK